MKKVIVIGSGIAGLAVSIRLASKGYSVKVFEKNDYPGGKLFSFTVDGYRFDGGPPLLTMPDFIAELYEIAGEKIEDHFKYSKKEIACKYFWQDGTVFNAYSDREKFLKEVEIKFNEPKEKVANYLSKAKKKFDLIKSIFLEQSLYKLKTLLSEKTIKALLKFKIFEFQKSLHKANENSFSSPYLIQLYDRYATYNGSNPYQTSGIMTLIQHLESYYGTFVPEKGMKSIAESLYNLAKRLGVKFHFNTDVNEIVIESKKAIGVKHKDSFIEADLVISNVDVFYTYKNLLPNFSKPVKILEQDRSSSAVIFYWGIKNSFKELDLHNIFFSKDYKKEFDAIFKNQTIYDDPTIYINITSKNAKEDAPIGCENWYVMVNSPSDNRQDWDQIAKKLRVTVIDKISKRLGVSLEDKIVCEEIMTPPIIQSKTKSYKGALYGTSSNNMMSAFLRHPNFSKKIKNLYFCGGSVHPGGGIPLCLLSARIVADLIPETKNESD